jgi:hypothetical protein
MVAQRRSKSAPDIAPRVEEINLGPRRTLRSGMQAWVLFPPRRTQRLATFLYADDRGQLTFTDPKNGGRRTVTPDAVGSIPRTQAPAR